MNEKLSCEDVELELSGPEPSAEARAHLAGCASCTETARVLGLATLPPLSETERLLLSGLAASTTREARAQRAPRANAGWGRLALAAGLGALLASGVVLKVTEPRVVLQTVTETRTELVAATELPDLSAGEASDFNLSDDDVFFEVGWPSPTEGDL
ncbi:MAG: hypothetical protein U0228_22390 [Myxococcaceae bacterium]